MSGVADYCVGEAVSTAASETGRDRAYSDGSADDGGNRSPSCSSHHRGGADAASRDSLGRTSLAKYFTQASQESNGCGDGAAEDRAGVDSAGILGDDGSIGDDDASEGLDNNGVGETGEIEGNDGETDVRRGRRDRRPSQWLPTDSEDEGDHPLVVNDGLDAKTVAELKKICSSHGLSVHKKKKKDLLLILRQHVKTMKREQQRQETSVVSASASVGFEEASFEVEALQCRLTALHRKHTKLIENWVASHEKLRATDAAKKTITKERDAFAKEVPVLESALRDAQALEKDARSALVDEKKRNVELVEKNKELERKLEMFAVQDLENLMEEKEAQAAEIKSLRETVEKNESVFAQLKKRYDAMVLQAEKRLSAAENKENAIQVELAKGQARAQVVRERGKQKERERRKAKEERAKERVQRSKEEQQRLNESTGLVSNKDGEVVSTMDGGNTGLRGMARRTKKKNKRMFQDKQKAFKRKKHYVDRAIGRREAATWAAGSPDLSELSGSDDDEGEERSVSSSHQSRCSYSRGGQSGGSSRRDGRSRGSSWHGGPGGGSARSGRSGRSSWSGRPHVQPHMETFHMPQMQMQMQPHLHHQQQMRFLPQMQIQQQFRQGYSPPAQLLPGQIRANHAQYPRLAQNAHEASIPVAESKTATEHAEAEAEADDADERTPTPALARDNESVSGFTETFMN